MAEGDAARESPAGPRPGEDEPHPALGAWSALTAPAAPPRDGYLWTDLRGVILDADEAAADLLLAGRAFLLGKPLGLLVAEGSRPAFYEFLTRPHLPGGGRAFEMRFRRPGVAARDVLALVEAAGAPGAAPAYRWQLRDITSIRRVEQALRAERHLLDGIIEAAQAIILVVDNRGRVLLTNRYLHEVCGYARHELNGRYWDEVLLLPRDRQLGQRLVHDAIHQGGAHTGVLALPSRNGGPRGVVWSARGHPLGGGAAAILGHDVTELQEAQRQALQAERLATIGQVVAGLAHESRNALQRLQACLTLLALRLEGQAPEAADLVNRAQRAQDDLKRLFEDVLGYAATPRLARARADLGAAWREAWADLEAARRGRRAELVEEACDTDLFCELDVFQMKRVFGNLFENSLASVADPVRVVIACQAVRLAGRPALRVSVRDNGPGFPPEVRRRLFEPFYTTKTHGTGLGLPICQRLVEAHGGRIEAGAAGPGAEIIITLPRRMS